MIVGQNPGWNEDNEGRPFIGKAGEYLDEVLADNGINRADCFVTNTVKCFTEGNRAPTKQEVKACLPYLWKEIGAVKPEYIALLGNTALSAIGKSGIMKYRGKTLEHNGSTYYPTVHPAAVLRNPKNDVIFRQDIAYLSILLRGEDSTPQYDVQYVTDFESFKEMLFETDKAKMIAYDIESEGFDERQGRIWLMGVAVSPTRAWILPVEHPESAWAGRHKGITHPLTITVKCLNSKTRWRVAQSGKFDNRWLKEKIGIAPRMNWDTMLASHLLNENTPHDLEYLSQTMLGVAPYKGKIIFTGEGLSSLKDMGDYCAEDCCNTYRIAEIQMPLLRNDPRLWKLYTKLILPLSHTLEDVERVGIYLDHDRLTSRCVEAKAKVEEFSKQMSTLVPHACQPPIKVYKRKPSIVLPWNFGSTQQVGRILFDDKGFGLTPYSLTPKGEPSTDDESITFLKDDAPEEAVKFLDTLSTYRTWRNKYLGTYIEPWTARLQGGRVYTSFKIHGTVTGRLSGDFQQVPREKFIRSIVSCPPGTRLVNCDQSQLELRLIAFASGDPRMTRVYQTEGDIHTETASIVTHRAISEITKEERFRAKAVNFGLCYGMSTNGFRKYAKTDYSLDLTQEEAELFRKRYFEAYKGLQPWHERQRQIARKLGYVRHSNGRIRRLPDIYSQDKYVRGEAERQAINSPIQGFGGEINNLTAIRAVREVDWNLAKLFLLIHDSLMWYIYEDYIDEATGIIRQVMEDRDAIRKTFDVELTIPLKADITVGQWWSE